MNKLLNIKLKDKPFDYLQFFLFIIISAKATVISRSDNWLVVLTILAAITFYVRKKKINYKFILFLVGYGLFILVFYFKFGRLNWTEYVRLFVKLLYAYFIVVLFAEKFVLYYEDIIYRLAFISIPFFAIQIISPQIIFSISKLMPRISSSETYANLIIYTIDAGQLNRNAGFAWEPGGFGAFLTIAIFINLIVNKFKSNRRLVILIIATLTTISTTSYLVLFLLGFFVLYKRVNNKAYLLMGIPIYALLIFLALQLEFISGKINSRYEASLNIHSNLNAQGKNRQFASLGRFGSLWADLNDLKSSPIFGTALERENRVKGERLFMQRTNGLSNYLVKFGFLGLFLFVFNLFKSSKIIFPNSQNYTNTFFVIMIFTISFSNPVLFTPVFLSFQLLYTRQ